MNLKKIAHSLKKKTSILLIIFMVGMALNSCDEDVIPTNSDNSNPPQIELTDEEFAQNNFGETITASFIGSIIGQEGYGIKDVEIVIGNRTTMTDHNGIFILNNVSVYENFAFIKASKNGYIKGSRTIVPTTNGVNDIQINLLKKNIVGTVNSGVSSTVTLFNGAKVEFEGEFVDQFGNPHSGSVDVSLHYLEPNIEETFLEMPGILFGKRENSSASAMETYGMLAVNLFSTSGEELNISSDSNATLTFPVSATTPNAPNEIALWYFDETVGFWKEQGIAFKQGNEYKAEVTHFTWWNCDLPMNSVNICFELSSENVLPNFYFEIVRDQTNQIVFSGTTNETGVECGLFPKNERLTMNVYGDCSGETLIHSQSLGPYTTDNSTIEIQIPSLPLEIIETTLTGTVSNCSGDSINNGYALLFKTDRTDFSDYDIIPITNGTFNHQYVYCEGVVYNMIIFDLDSGEVSGEITNIAFSEGTTNLGNVATCEGVVGGTFNGDIVLNTQEEVDAFGLFGYSAIDGRLNIGINSNCPGTTTSNIVSLINLQSLTSINGGLTMTCLFELESLEGLENITTITNVYISNLTSLLDLNGLKGLTSADTLELNGIDSLENLNGLENVTHVDLLNISRMDSLTSLDGLGGGLISVSDNLWIQHNSSLLSLAGLESVTGLGSKLFISGNDVLSNLSGLDNLEFVLGRGVQIVDNDSMNNLVGLENLFYVEEIEIIRNSALNSLTGLDGLTNLIGSLFIGTTSVNGSLTSASNENLTDYCALTNLFTGGSFNPGGVYIYYNAYNPTIQDIRTGNCSE